MDLFIPAPITRYLPGRVVREGASDEAVGAVREQIITRAPGAAGEEDAE